MIPFRPAKWGQGSCNDLEGLALTPSRSAGINKENFRQSGSFFAAILAYSFAVTDMEEVSAEDLLGAPAALEVQRFF